MTRVYSVRLVVWVLVACTGLFFFFQRKTAYEMRISYWSSDVFSADLVARGIAEGHRREISVARGDGKDQGARLGRGDGDAEKAAGRAEGTASRRQQMDRHRGYIAFREQRLQSRRRPHRRRRQAWPRDQGLGQARVQGPGQHGGAWYPQHQGGASPPAPFRARGRGRRARPGRHDQGYGPTRLAGYRDAAGTAQRGQAAAVPGCRRINGPAYQAVRGTVLRRHQRVQASGVLLFPQLPL